jgi:hypothetical protein
MKNVIDLTSRLKNRKNSTGKVAVNAAQAPVIDMTEKRNEILSKERRQVRRTILSEFVGASVVVPGKGLMKVALFDISESGLAFDIEDKAGHFSLGEEVSMRVYLNHQTYFGFVVKVQNTREILDEGVYRHGAGFVKGTVNDQALFHFVKFIETVSASLQGDKGDLMVSNLTR